MIGNQGRLSPLSAYDLTPEHFKSLSLGDFIDCFFPQGYGNEEALEAFMEELGGDWNNSHKLSPEESCELWMSLIKKGDVACTSAA